MDAITKLNEAANGDLYDAAYGGWLVEATETAETLADFEAAAAGYAEARGFRRGEIAGLPFVAWESVQISKGDQRRALAVVDLGDKRVAIVDDLSSYV